jgi:hypothetical protein
MTDSLPRSLKNADLAIFVACIVSRYKRVKGNPVFQIYVVHFDAPLTSWLILVHDFGFLVTDVPCHVAHLPSELEGPAQSDGKAGPWVHPESLDCTARLIDKSIIPTAQGVKEF